MGIAVASNQFASVTGPLTCGMMRRGCKWHGAFFSSCKVSMCVVCFSLVWTTLGRMFSYNYSTI